MEVIANISFWLLFVLSLACAFRLTRLLIKGKTSGYLFVIPIVYVFYIIPIYTDFFFDIVYDKYPYVLQSLQDPLTNTIYNIYFGSILLFLTYKSTKAVGNKWKAHVLEVELNNNILRFYTRFKYMLWAIIFAPIVALLLSDDPSYYFTYRALLGFGGIIEKPEMHQTLSRFCSLSSLAISFVITVLLIRRKYKKGKSNSFLFPLLVLILLLDFWLHGKRSIVAIYMACQVVLVLTSQSISIKKSLKYISIGVLFFVGFLSFYGKSIKDNSRDTYIAFRTDFSRDYGVKLAIYNDLLNDNKILPRPFQSYLFNVTFFVPREIWPKKPYPYAIYFTNAAFGRFGDDREYGWALTTSIFSEAISNVSWLGFFIAPIVLNFILKRESKSTSPLFRLLSIIICILSLVLHPISFMIMIILYLLLLLKEGNSRKIVWKK